MKYPVILENGLDGWIVARCPTLRGCVSQGETRAEALANICEAIELTLEVRKEMGLPLTDNDLKFIESVEVEISTVYDEATEV